jgi:hypothetical protein
MFRREDYTVSGKLIAYSPIGGYPLFYLVKDGGVLCPECANSKECAQATPDCPDDAQWYIVDVGTNWEDAALECDNCGKYIERAFTD